MLNVEIILEFSSLPKEDPFDEAPALPENLTELFNPPGGERIYAVLDAARVPLLPERLASSALRWTCLYQDTGDDGMADVAPYLVELDPSDALTRALLRSADTPQPDALMGADAAIFLRSTGDFETVLGRLRRLTMLPDEDGRRYFFRLSEPGMLAAACISAPEDEQAFVFDGFSDILWTRASLEDGEWQVLRAGLAPDAPRSPKRVLTIGPTAREALRIAVCERKARDLARAHTSDVDERIERAETYLRLMRVRYENEGWLRTTFDLMQRLAGAVRQHAWTVLESGKHSLGQAHARIAAAAGQEPILP